MRVIELSVVVLMVTNLGSLGYTIYRDVNTESVRKTTERHELAKAAWGIGVDGIGYWLHEWLSQQKGGDEKWNSYDPRLHPDSTARLKSFSNLDIIWVNDRSVTAIGYIQPNWVEPRGWYKWKLDLTMTDSDTWAPSSPLEFETARVTAADQEAWRFSQTVTSHYPD